MCNAQLIENKMYAKQPHTVVSRAVHIHPTVTELIPTVLQELQPLESGGRVGAG